MFAELGRRIVEDSLTLARALGYDMDSMEWAVRDGVPYAIDFMNPAPDMDIYSLTPEYFAWTSSTWRATIQLADGRRTPPEHSTGGRSPGTVPPPPRQFEA